MWVAIRAYVISGVMGLIIIGLIWYAGYQKGQASADVKCATHREAAIEKGVMTHAKIDQKVKKLSDPDLDRALSKFMRD